MTLRLNSKLQKFGRPGLSEGKGSGLFLPRDLTWTPPVLDANFVTWSPNNSGFSGRDFVAGGKDVLVLMPAFALTNNPGNYPAMQIHGAKNIVIQGGRFSIPTSGGNEFQRDAFAFVGCTGIIHVEGCQMGLSSEFCMNGFDMYNSPLAQVQAQNCEIVVRASDPVNFTDGHPDGFFTDNVGNSGFTLGKLLIDRCRIDTDYQGISLFGKGCSVYVQRTHIKITERGQAASTQGFWQSDNTNNVVFGPNVYLEKRASQAYGLSVHPDTTDGTVARRPTVSATDITYPTEPTISGRIIQGAPPVDMIPTDRGIGYTPRAVVQHL